MPPRNQNRQQTKTPARAERQAKRAGGAVEENAEQQLRELTREQLLQRLSAEEADHKDTVKQMSAELDRLQRKRAQEDATDPTGCDKQNRGGHIPVYNTGDFTARDLGGPSGGIAGIQIPQRVLDNPDFAWCIDALKAQLVKSNERSVNDAVTAFMKAAGKAAVAAERQAELSVVQGLDQDQDIQASLKCSSFLFQDLCAAATLLQALTDGGHSMAGAVRDEILMRISAHVGKSARMTYSAIAGIHAAFKLGAEDDKSDKTLHKGAKLAMADKYWTFTAPAALNDEKPWQPTLAVDVDKQKCSEARNAARQAQGGAGGSRWGGHTGGGHGHSGGHNNSGGGYGGGNTKKRGYYGGHTSGGQGRGTTATAGLGPLGAMKRT